MGQALDASKRDLRAKLDSEKAAVRALFDSFEQSSEATNSGVDALLANFRLVQIS